MNMHAALFEADGWWVRPATDDDQAPLLAVYTACEDFLALGPVAQASAAMVAADRRLSAERGGVYCVVCAADGPVCGVVDFVPRLPGGPDQAYLELLMLAAPYRNRGWGAAIFSALRTYLTALGVRRLLAGVQVNNPAAKRFWLYQGFVITGGPELLADGTTVYDLACEF
jgi:GNAT superfamily N-acetyltransferase